MAQKDVKVNIALAESSAAIAQASKEDSAVMRTIAIESKKDSSAMKTIAVLGMFFLPGTFVAAIFAMPVFNWDGNSPIIKPAFKYYWAVTGPLTLFVLLSWALAMLLPWKLWLSMVNGGRKNSNGEVELTT
jgi:Mg2+ and Co2+ transporter CorA